MCKPTASTEHIPCAGVIEHASVCWNATGLAQCTIDTQCILHLQLQAMRPMLAIPHGLALGQRMVPALLQHIAALHC